MRIFIVLLLSLSFQNNAFSDEQQIIALGDIEFGEYLAGECSACHHQAGLSKGIPSINGLDAEVFVALMVAYRSKEMEHPVMQMIAGRLDDEEIGSLALYFSKLDPPK
jgi:cytochrome c